VSIKDLERELTKAERAARAPFLHEDERARRWDRVHEIERDLAAAEDAAEEELAGRGRSGGFFRW
jgi:hypothetical protein